MGQAFGELGRARALITETLKLEETRFKETVARGLRLLNDEVDKLGGEKSLPGEVAFKLYDTYGFPLDLTQDVLRGQGRDVDTAGFETAMRRAPPGPVRARQRPRRSGSSCARRSAPPSSWATKPSRPRRRSSR